MFLNGRNSESMVRISLKWVHTETYSKFCGQVAVGVSCNIKSLNVDDRESLIIGSAYHTFLF